MPASRRACKPEPRQPPARSLRRDDAVSEVIGQIIMFGILAMILVLSLVGFNTAKDGAQARVADANAESISQRIASAVVDAALFAETAGDEDILLQMDVHLPDEVEGDPYTIELDEDEVRVTVQRVGREAGAPLFASGTPSAVAVCVQTGTDDAVSGGSVRVQVSAHPPAPCTAGGGILTVYLESIT